MEENYLKEKANCLRNEMNHVWTGMLVTGGGVIGFLIMQEKNLTIYILMVMGFLLALLFLNAYIIRRLELSETITNLRKERGNNEKYSRYNM